MAVGPESLALLEAGECGWGVDGSDGAYLLAEYARVLGLDQAVVRGWLRGNGRLPLTGSARFARPLAFVPVVAPTASPADPYLALKEARVRAGLSLEDTGHLLDMRSDFVTTMERGDVGRLPRGYERGMLTRYSALLGLDPRPALAGLPGSTSVARPSRPKRPRRVALWIRFSGGVLIVLGLVLAAISVS
ncbi:MAG: helix-turn-helix domain-containing protein [Thermoleophilia bacterium]